MRSNCSFALFPYISWQCATSRLCASDSFYLTSVLIAIALYSPDYNPQLNTGGEVFMDCWIETQIAPARC